MIDDRLGTLAVRADGTGWLLDLSEVSWLDPVHLVGIAATAHRAARSGRRLRVTGLRSDQSGYAARMHLGRVLERFGAVHELPTVIELDRSDSLLEVTELDTPADVRRLAELVFDRVATVERQVATALWHGLAEIGGNVCDHSGTIGFMAAQTVHDRRLLRFAVADAGVGMLATLAPAGATDDRSAVNMALSGTSRTSAPGHGTGLPSTIEVVSRLNGSVVLASGRAATWATARGRRHRTLDFTFAGTIFEGTVPAVPARRRDDRPYANAENLGE